MVKFNLPGLPESNVRNADFVPAGTALQQETNSLLETLDVSGISVPRDITSGSLLQGIGKAYLPEEMPPANLIGDISPSSQQQFARVIQPNLNRMLKQTDPRAFKIGHQLGRLIGAGIAVPGFINAAPPIMFGTQEINVDGFTLPHSVEDGLVVEFGLGLNGLHSHLQATKANKYRVIGIHKSKAEVSVLKGITDYYMISGTQVALSSQGITRDTQDIVRVAPGSVDVVVASRVHAAGSELRQSISRLPELLRSDGLFVARGPRRFQAGFDYDRVLSQVSATRGLTVTHTSTFDRNHHGKVEPNRLIIASKS